MLPMDRREFCRRCDRWANQWHLCDRCRQPFGSQCSRGDVWCITTCPCCGSTLCADCKAGFVLLPSGKASSGSQQPQVVVVPAKHAAGGRPPAGVPPLREVTVTEQYVAAKPPPLNRITPYGMAKAKPVLPRPLRPKAEPMAEPKAADPVLLVSLAIAGARNLDPRQQPTEAKAPGPVVDVEPLQPEPLLRQDSLQEEAPTKP